MPAFSLVLSAISNRHHVPLLTCHTLKRHPLDEVLHLHFLAFLTFDAESILALMLYQIAICRPKGVMNVIKCADSGESGNQNWHQVW